MMSEKRFEKGYDDKGNALFIYDNQTDKMYYLEGAINLLNSLNDELEDSSAFIIEQRKENKGLREENEQLKIENEFLKKENEEHKALIEKRWGEYMQKKFKENEE